MKMFKIITILLLINLSNAMGAISTTDRNLKLNDIESSIKDFVTQNINRFGKCKKIHYRVIINDLLDDLYRAGFISLNQISSFMSDFEQVSNGPGNTEDCKDEGGAFKNRMHNLISTKFQSFRSNFDKKNEGEVSQGIECKASMYSLPNRFFEKDNSCGKKGGESCNGHSECCSKNCMKSGTSKTCAAVKTCFKLIQYDQECSDRKPYCDQSSLGQSPLGDQGATSTIKCININYNSTNTNSCISQFNPNATCQENEQCCSNKCENGKCVKLNKCFQCKSLGQEPQGNIDCCPGLRRGIGGKCILSLPPMVLPPLSKVENKKSFIQIALNSFFSLFVENSHAVQLQGENDTDIQTSQNDTQSTSSRELKLEDERNLQISLNYCLEYPNDGETPEDHNRRCGEAYREQKQNIISQYTDEDRSQLGQESISRTDYNNLFGLPSFQGIEKSDASKCEFNSVADNWLDSGPSKKNARIVAMALEVAFSGMGTEDFIKVKDDDSKNIYQSIKSISNRLSKSRAKMIKTLHDKDIQLTCLCLKTLGINNFENKKDFYTERCSEYVDISQDSGSQENQMDTVTGAATGIALESVLVEWLSLKSSTEIDWLIENVDAEEELKTLIENLNNLNWTESQADQEILYSFTESGWTVLGAITIVVGAIAVGFIPIVGPYLGVAMVGSFIAFGGNSDGGPFFWDSENMTNDHDDRQTGRDDGWFETEVYYDRYYTYEKFNGNGCNINSKNKSYCVKNFFIPSKPNFITSEEYTEFIQNNEGSTIIDISLPLFFPNSPGLDLISDKQITNKINEAHVRGVQKLKDGAPSDEVSQGWSQNSPFTEDVIKAFTPQFDIFNDNGEVNPTFNFSQDYINSYITAVKKYAYDCRDRTLKECGGTSVDDDTLGFYKVIQSEENATLFAQYVYQLHFLWPKLSKKVAYPPMGLIGYLNTVYYHIKYIASLNAGDSTNYDQAAQKYIEDLEKRRGIYGDKGTNNELGFISKNSKYTPELFSAMRLVNFQTGEGVEAFSKKIDVLTKSGSLSKGDIKAAGAIKRHAFNLQKTEKEKEHYDQTYGKTKRGKIEKENFDKFLKNFGTPLGVDAFNSNNVSAKFNNKQKDERENKVQNFSKIDFGSDFSPQKSSKSFNKRVSTSRIIPSHGLTDGQVNSILNEVKRNKSLYDTKEGDSIFGIVSKCYKRNLSRVLETRKSIDASSKKEKVNSGIEEDKKTITDEKKNELKSLLGN